MCQTGPTDMGKGQYIYVGGIRNLWASLRDILLLQGWFHIPALVNVSHAEWYIHGPNAGITRDRAVPIKPPKDLLNLWDPKPQLLLSCPFENG